ncbi:hypothetical protein AAW00_12495 [Aurantiacibacter luteus]|uniref:Uncharacterized protein n=1 Tax=Aurantiacibacter luteus TaxID=1581420 RepID=A0A0G9MT20_9SPHN|nr:hypothetical protein AAW00_12495 [Aurantiacibacter luteus]
MGSKRLDSLGDYLRHHYTLRVDCRGCKKVSILQPLVLLELCQKRGWGHQMREVERRLKCGSCGGRDVRIGPGFGG